MAKKKVSKRAVKQPVDPLSNMLGDLDKQMSGVLKNMNISINISSQIPQPEAHPQKKKKQVKGKNNVRRKS